MPVFLLTLVFLQPQPPVKAEKNTVQRCKLVVQMNDRQPADAPIIFSMKLCNTSREDIPGHFEQHPMFRAYLRGPDGNDRPIVVTNGSPKHGSLGRADRLKPGECVTTHFRLTIVSLAPSDYLPSEQVYLPPGSYRLLVDRLNENSRVNNLIVDGIGERAFQVVRDVTLAKERHAELANPPKELERFAKHVRETTLTPELRREWYTEIVNRDAQRARFKVYALSAIQNPPPDVGPALLEALKVHVPNPNINDRDVSGLVSNATHAMLPLKPPGAGQVLLKLATSNHQPSNRVAAIEALMYHYYEEEMAEQLIPLLKDDTDYVGLSVARLFAMRGDDRAVELVVKVASDPKDKRRVFAAATLGFLSQNEFARAALQKTLMSADEKFVTALKTELSRIPSKPKDAMK
ncbi:MAG: HEAT repeat domain-containing protein [Planctomycetales bacterium]|nr:HEAT repeat domain-containing protein [Planctomycetales bacterium]